MFSNIEHIPDGCLQFLITKCDDYGLMEGSISDFLENMNEEDKDDKNL